MTTNLDTTFHLKCEYHTVPDKDADYAFADVNDIVVVLVVVVNHIILSCGR